MINPLRSNKAAQEINKNKNEMNSKMLDLILRTPEKVESKILTSKRIKINRGDVGKCVCQKS